MQISSWRRRKSSPGGRIREIGLGFAGAAWIRDGGVAGSALGTDPGATGKQRGRRTSHGEYCIVYCIQWPERGRIDKAQKGEDCIEDEKKAEDRQKQQKKAEAPKIKHENLWKARREAPNNYACFGWDISLGSILPGFEVNSSFLIS